MIEFECGARAAENGSTKPEEVVKLLDTNGGREWYAAVGREAGWSRPAAPEPVAKSAQKLEREHLFEVIQKRAVGMHPDSAPEQAVAKYVMTPEGADLYRNYVDAASA